MAFEIIRAEGLIVPDEVCVTDKPGGKIIGTAKLTKTHGGSVMAEVTITDQTSNPIENGLTIGAFSILEDR
jgi:hypothetical protein